MNIHNTILRGALCITLLLGASQVPAAVVLSLLPAAQDAAPPQFVDLDLVISGLGDHGAPSLGAFDLYFSFDSSKLSFDSYTLGNFLGALDGVEADNLSVVSGNPINLAVGSYLSATDLATLQPSGFSLGTLTFQVINLSVYDQTWVRFASGNKLSDQQGQELPIAATNDAVIPAPPAILLCGLGLLLLIHNRRRGSVASGG